jgi:hypothetical protein
MTETQRSLLQIAFMLPLLFFFIAAVLEFRRDRTVVKSLNRFGPLIAGALGAVLLLVPVTSFLTTIHSSVVLSRVMVFVSLCAAAGGIFSRYKSRWSSALVIAGGGILAFFWFFNRIMV